MTCSDVCTSSLRPLGANPEGSKKAHSQTATFRGRQNFNSYWKAYFTNHPGQERHHHCDSRVKQCCDRSEQKIVLFVPILGYISRKRCKIEFLFKCLSLFYLRYLQAQKLETLCLHAAHDRNQLAR